MSRLLRERSIVRLGKILRLASVISKNLKTDVSVQCFPLSFCNFRSSGIFLLLENFLNFRKKLSQNIDERCEDRRTAKYLFDVIIRVNYFLLNKMNFLWSNTLYEQQLIVIHKELLYLFIRIICPSNRYINVIRIMIQVNVDLFVLESSFSTLIILIDHVSLILVS